MGQGSIKGQVSCLYSALRIRSLLAFVLGLADDRLGDHFSRGTNSASKNLLAIGAILGRHSAIAKRLIAECEERLQRGLFEAGLPVIRRAASFVKVNPGAIG